MLPEQFVRNTENQLQQPAQVGSTHLSCGRLCLAELDLSVFGLMDGQVLRALYASVRTCPIVWRMTSTHLSGRDLSFCGLVSCAAAAETSTCVLWLPTGWLTLDEGRDRLLRKKTRQVRILWP